jgi:polyhydroxyalkanoate synthase
MNEQPSDSNAKSGQGADPAADFARIAEESQRLIGDFLSRHGGAEHLGHGDPLNIANTFFEMTARLLANPAQLAETQLSLWRSHMELWQQTTRRLMGEETEPLVTPHVDDRRFQDKEWSENPLFDYIKQSYLLTARWLKQTAADVEGLDQSSQRKVDFYTRQFVDALSPTNFFLSNPEVLRATVESRGDNLIQGLRNLLDDLARSEGSLAIKMVEPSAFTVGENIAMTPGKVVFRNDLMELIQYAPTTEDVYRRPLLVVPPWINKYYILDLRPKNSFIRWAVEQGYTLFIVSWVNPDERHAQKNFVDYMKEGPLAALDAIEQATGEREVTAIGYCLGGTLLAATLAYMAAKKDGRIKAATFFASLVDFENPGDLAVFIDEQQLSNLEKRMGAKGYLDKEAMAKTFNMLRANDLIWSFVVNNYLLGKEPFPFDLLYWNNDGTRMPAVMHSFYLRNMYIENKLREPGGIELDGVAIDLTKIKQPTYILAAKEDHIAPWEATFAACGLYRGSVRYVLAASGHVAGVINPPASEKYAYWKGAVTSEDPAAWLAAAKKYPGSWWPDWDRWNRRRSGKKVTARQPGEGRLEPLGDAPGSYVLG